MPKITEEVLEAAQIKFFKADLDYLRQMFRNNIGVNKAVRQIIRSYVIHAKARAATSIDAAEPLPELTTEDISP